METQNTHQTTHHDNVKSEKKSISIPLPRLSLPGLQSVILILLIVVGLLQAVQLYGLKQNITNAQLKSSSPTIAAPVTNTSSGSSPSALPTMVGGC